MSAGKLNRIITIEHGIDEQDEYGGVVPVWHDFAETWAAVLPLKGREFIAAQAAQSEVSVRFITRYIPGVNPAMRIVYDGKVYEIISVIDVEERHRELEIMAKVTVNRG